MDIKSALVAGVTVVVFATWCAGKLGLPRILAFFVISAFVGWLLWEDIRDFSSDIAAFWTQESEVKFWTGLLLVLAMLGLSGELLGFWRLATLGVIIVVSIGALVLKGINADFPRHDYWRR